MSKIVNCDKKRISGKKFQEQLPKFWNNFQEQVPRTSSQNNFQNFGTTSKNKFQEQVPRTTSKILEQLPRTSSQNNFQNQSIDGA
jgi:hypothetical protein